MCKALISVEGVPYLAVHREGGPLELGRKLYDTILQGRSIMPMAHEHVVTAVVPRLLTRMNLGRLAALAEKHKYREDQIEQGMRRGWNLGTEDQLIVSIKDYGDEARHQYDLQEDGVYWRPLAGYWPESVKAAGKFRKIGWTMLERLKCEQGCSEEGGDEM